MKLVFECFGIIHHTVILDHNAFRPSGSTGGVENISHAVGDRLVGKRFGGRMIAAETISDDKIYAGCAHHVVYAFLWQRRFGRDIGCSAFQHRQHRGYHLRTMAHYYADGGIMFRLEFRHNGICHTVEFAVCSRAAVFSHGNRIGLRLHPLRESAVYCIILHFS